MSIRRGPSIFMNVRFQVPTVLLM